jgi:hypothetical protein
VDYQKLGEPGPTRGSVRRALWKPLPREITVSEADVDAEVAPGRVGAAPQAIRSLLERGNELDGLRLAREAKTLALLVEHAKIEPGR